MKILLIGYGRVGKEIAENLIKLSVIENIFVYSKNTDNARHISRKVTFVKDISVLKEIDYVIVSISGVPEKQWNEIINNEENLYKIITVELDYNIPEINSIIEKLKLLSQKTKIILLTNPVDIITNYLIPILKNEVIGFGGELDVLRYKNELNQDLFCIGLHNNCVPIANFQSLGEINKVTAKISKQVIAQLRKERMNHKITGETFSLFFEKLTSKDKHIVSICYSKKGELAYTRPFFVCGGKILEEVAVKPNKFESKLFSEAYASLKKSVEELPKHYI